MSKRNQIARSSITEVYARMILNFGERVLPDDTQTLRQLQEDLELLGFDVQAETVEKYCIEMEVMEKELESDSWF